MQRTVSSTVLTAALVAMAVIAIAAVPQVINYQGKLTNGSGEPVSDGDYQITFTIYDQAAGGTDMWSSGAQLVPVANGFFTYQFGSAVQLPDDLFTDTLRWLGIQVGGDPEISPRTKLTSVAYAYHSLRCDTAATLELPVVLDWKGDFDATLFVRNNADGGAVHAVSSPGHRAGYFVGDVRVTEDLTVEGAADVAGFTMATGASNGYVLTSDGAGVGTWQTAAGGGGGWVDDGSVVRLESASDYVGIGTASPGGHRLYVQSPVGGVDGASAFVKNTAANGLGMIVENESSDLTMLLSQLGGGDILRCDSWTGGWHPVFAIENNGKTLIGSSAADAGLDVYGEARFRDSTMTVNSTGIRIGDPEAPTFSDLVHIERHYNSTGSRYGLYMDMTNQNNGALTGVYGRVEHTTAGTAGQAFGLYGSVVSDGNARYGVTSFVQAQNVAIATGNSFGVLASAYDGANAYGIYGSAGSATNNYAGYFNGNVHVTGSINKAACAFRIDHPLDPENRYLVHTCVESPDMMNVYNGNVVLDGSGGAVIELPEYFEALNKDFRYQLTAIGAPGPNLYIAEEISGNQFRIAGGEAGMKVSWQVTGIRKDAYAEANRVQVEVDKPDDERGLYLHPEAHGLGPEKFIHYELLNKAFPGEMAERSDR